MSEVNVDVRADSSGRRYSWGLGAAIATAVIAWVLGSAAIIYAVSANRSAADENRDALVYLCSTTTTFRLIIEQLEIVDRQLARDPNIAPTVRATIASRLAVYRAAVSELSATKPCEEIE